MTFPRHTRRPASTMTKETRAVTLLRPLNQRSFFHPQFPTIGLSAVGVVAVAMGLFLPATPADAAASPAWHISSLSAPTDFSAADSSDLENPVSNTCRFGGSLSTTCDQFDIRLANLGAAPTDGSPVIVTDTLPPGLTTQATPHSAFAVPGAQTMEEGWLCAPAGPGQHQVSCTYELPVPALAQLPPITVPVRLSNLAPDTRLTNEVSVEGGGAPSTQATSTVLVEPTAPPPFGLSLLESYPADPAAAQALTTAAAHPAAFYTNLELNSVHGYTNPPIGFGGGPSEPVQDPRQLIDELPLGFVGNPLAVPLNPETHRPDRCPISLLSPSTHGDTNVTPEVSGCPADTQVGVISFDVLGGSYRESFPIYNLVPESGYPAEFGFTYANERLIMLATVLHTPSGYALRVSIPGIPRLVEFSGAELTFFGNPTVQDGGSSPGKAFFTDPSHCSTAPLRSTLYADSWQEPGRWAAAESLTYPEITGCNQLDFEPTVEARPTTNVADSPSGLEFHLQIPQGEEEPETRATPPLHTATVALPEGMAVNPSSATGLAGCAPTGPRGINIGSGEVGPEGRDIADPEATEIGEGHEGGNGSRYDDGLYHTAPGHCPAASQIGTVEVTTPLLEEPLHGHLYLGTPACAPCSAKDAEEGKLIHLYIEVADPQAGVIAKLAGTTHTAPDGQLTAVFAENPQLPFSDLKLHVEEGARAPLRTPPTCGGYQTTTDLEPWSAPETPAAEPSDSFQIESAPGGEPSCPTTAAQLPNKPRFTAGTQSPAAGAFSPFLLRLSREEGSQELKALNVTLPPGLTGRLAGVAECSDAQIAAAEHSGGNAEHANPSCPLASEVGTVNVGAGAGPDPYYVQGHAYLAGPYKGAPISLAIITPALAGPFDLGTVVVRAALYVNPETAQITTKSDPIPTILDGIPLDVRSVAVQITRNQFTLNPTNCSHFSLTGTAFAASSEAALTNPFQVGGCQALGFKPSVGLSLKGGTKRNQNPALTAVVTYPKGAYANIASASVALPHSEFLDQAHIKTICTRVQFAEGGGNGEKCPSGSVYGYAKAETPLLDNPLQGPVYLRSSSHNLPDLVVALGGQISVDLDGRVDTDKADGIRNSFEVVPDAPVSKFTLSMQGGEKGLLVNSEDICRKPQRATVDLTAQNGKVDDFNPLIANSCKGKAKKGRGKHHHKH